MSPEHQKQTTETVEQPAFSIEDILASTKAAEKVTGRDQAEKDQTTTSLRVFVDDLLGEKVRTAEGEDVDLALQQRIAELDELISAQVNEILHNQEVQRLEASWRGLDRLVSQSRLDATLRIKVMNIGKDELIRDVVRAKDFSKSDLYRKVYNEYDVLGATPFGALMGDYEFTDSEQDISLLKRMSQIASASQAPFISAMSPKFFGWDSFAQLETEPDIGVLMTNPRYDQWNTFRRTEDAKYVALVAPHVLRRAPYGPDSAMVEGFVFTEDVDGTDTNKLLWGNAAYDFAARLTNAFANFGWCTAIRGVENGGLVTDLPKFNIKSKFGDDVSLCPTEIAITNTREKELADAGFNALLHYKGTTNAVFLAAKSAQKEREFVDPADTANARLATELQYTMAVTRFAHYLKAILMDKVGKGWEQNKIKDYLSEWFSAYTLLDDNASDEAKASRPLRNYQVEVEPVPGKPGSYRAIALLRPHFQLNEIGLSLRLVAEAAKKSS